MFNKNFKDVDGIKIFDINDKTALQVIDFYTEDPFPNYENNENKSSILIKGDKNQYTFNLKKVMVKVLEVGAIQLSNYLLLVTIINSFLMQILTHLNFGKEFAQRIILKI